MSHTTSLGRVRLSWFNPRLQHHDGCCPIAVWGLDTLMMLESAATMDSSACSFSVPFGHTYKFTGKERDTESGLDMFGARYYGSSLGRFMTPDWAAKATAVPYAVFGDPQTLNLYSYLRNNPLSRADLDGHSDYLW